MTKFSLRKNATNAMRIDARHNTQPSALLRGFGLLTIAMLTMSGTIMSGSAAQAIAPTEAEQPTELGALRDAPLDIDVFYHRRATMDSVAPGEVVTITTEITNRGSASLTEETPVKFTDDLAKMLNQANLLEGSFTSTMPGWTMGELSGDSKLPFSGPLSTGETATLTYQVQVMNLADLKADFILDSDSAGDITGVQCGGECWTYTPIEKSLSITPANSTTMYSQKVTYEAVITDGFDAERTVTNDTTFTSQAGTMADNVLTVQMIGTGFETVATFGQFTATATVNGTASNVPAVTINPSNGSTISGTGVTGNTVVVTLPSGKAETVVVVDGKWSITPSEPLANGDLVTVAQKDSNGISSPAVTVTVDQAKPAAPTVNISNGKTISGGPIANGNTLTFTDGQQNPVAGELVVDPQTGLFTFTPATPFTDTDTVNVVVTSPAGNSSDPTSVTFVTTKPTTPSVETSNGKTITGGPVAQGDKVTVVDGTGKNVPGTVEVDSEGNFTFTPTTPLTDNDTASVVVTGPSGLESTPAVVDLVTKAPKAPAVNVSNGTTVTGGPIASTDTVTIVDGEGKTIPGSVEMDANGNFVFTPATPLDEDTTATVLVTGPSGLVSTPKNIIVVTKAPGTPTVKPSNGITITGGPVGKNDTVTVVDGEGKTIPGELIVDGDGNFTFTPTTPLTEDDTAKVVVTGPSGLETETGNIDIVTTAPTTPTVKPSDGKTITGGPIGKDDVVSVVDGEGKTIPSELIVDGDGNFTFTPTTPLTEDDTAKVIVTGPSGLETETGNIDVITTAPTTPVVKPSDGKTITGGPIGKDDVVTVVDGEGKEITGTVEVDGDGNFTFTPTTPLTEDDTAKVIVTGPSGLETETGNIDIVTKAPTTPTVKPSDGKTITGGPIGKDDVVTVVDGEGKDIPGQLVIDGDGNFTFTPTTPLSEDDTAKVIVTGPSGIETETGTVDIVTTAPLAPALKPSNGKTITGGPVAKGEAVIVLDGDNNEILGSVEIDDKGNFVFTPKTPLTEGDVAKVIVVGPSQLHSEATDVVMDFVAPDAPLVNPSNGSVISGTAEAGSTVNVYDANDKLIGQATAGADGAFTVNFNPALGNKEAVTVTATDAAGNESNAAVLKIDATVPAVPTVKPSDGKTVTGCAKPGSTVTVSDAAGNVIGTATAGDDCSYTVTLTPEQTPGSKVSIVVTSPSGVSSEAIALSVGAVSMKLESASVAQGEKQVARGYAFQPGEVVAGIMHSTPFDLGTQVADADGAVTFEFAVPADAEIGSHSVKLTGAFSGEISQEFAVTTASAGGNTAVETDSDPTSLALTGSDPMLMLSSGLLMLLLGAGLVLVLRKRRSAVTAE